MPALIEGRIGALDRIGRKVNTESAEEALLRGGLANWNVRKQRMRTSSNVTVPNKYAVVRDNPETGKVEYMSVVGTRYQITQNEEHIDFLQALVDESHSTFTTVADLNNGNLVYIQMRLPEGIMIGGRDPVDMYLTGINSFDGKTPFMVGLYPERAFCANQLPYFRQGAFKIRHTDSITNKVQAARSALGLLWAEIEGFQAEANALIEKELTDIKFEAIMDKLFPKPEKNQSSRWEENRETLREIYRGTTQHNITGTAWGGYNAVTEFMDHYQAVKGKGDENVLRAQRTLASTATREIKARALDLFAAV
jgi:phage/plasmid-like protein (TIGR03299 family)